ncbi:Transglutaminase elicitor m81c, partial [Globisporangium splendens]
MHVSPALTAWTIIVMAITTSVHGASLYESPVTMATNESEGFVLNDDHPARGEALSVDSPVFTTVTGEARELNNATDLSRLEAFFGVAFDRKLANLPERGDCPTMPWPSGYWPSFLDGINYEWDQGRASPAEKYARAFDLNISAFMTTVSETNGVLKRKTRRVCTTDRDCSDLKDGSVCGKRKRETSGFCIPTWFGLCHAWAPAAIMEPEPKCAVTMNGVEFKAMDIKALITEVYDGADLPTVFTGSRFNGNDTTDKTMDRDKFGRHLDPRFRDLGAGFFHIAIANILGKLKKSVVVDVTAGREVWNQPVRGYQVLEATPWTLKDAAQVYFGMDKFPFNDDAVSLMRMTTRFSWIVEALEDGPLVLTLDPAKFTDFAEYTYFLELDANGEIVGGEWIEKSLDEHPDFLWFPQTTPALDVVSKVGIAYSRVRQLLEQSVNGNCMDPGNVVPAQF